MGLNEMTERVGVEFLHEWLLEFARVVKANKDLLTSLDAAVGDADHGINMDRGMTAVLANQEANPPGDPAGLLKQTGVTLVSSVGGASGPLYGTFFLRMATAAAEHADGLDAAAFAQALRAGIGGVVQRGKAEPGDKTMYDALAPAAQALEDALAAGAPLTDALQQAAKAADQGRDGTTGMRARKGRASYLGERSVGHQDPGATSAALLIASAAASATKIIH
ncbi:dihydroxyacetone kinase subunit DhaL [Pseudonocardia eucalypti]|uniref:Dihydroxyacetone kinase subunit DhaL n=2 Tax=Pseudonocardia eucalypti TaxID=648755 RepID=A0ABP9RCF0_9PSEU